MSVSNASPVVQPTPSLQRTQVHHRAHQPGIFSQIIKSAPLLILAYYASGWVTSHFSKDPSSMIKNGPPPASPLSKIERDYLTVPVWPYGTSLDVYVRLSTSASVYGGGREDVGLPRTKFSGVQFGDWNWEKIWEIDFDVPHSVQNNGTLWAQFVVAKAGSEIDHRKPGYNALNVYRRGKVVTRYLPKRNVRKTKSLLGGHGVNNSTPAPAERDVEHAQEPVPVISYYHPNLTIGLVTDLTVLPLNRLPPVIQSHVHVPPTRERDPVTQNYYRYPVLFPNDFWLLKDSLVPINQTTRSLHMRLAIQPISHWKFQLYASMTVAFDQQASAAGGSAELDEVKRMFTETAPWLLITTFIVSALHALFEFLAFSSDVSHWRNKKELVGVSIRTILSNIFVQAVVLLYLIDNSDGTSWIVLLGQGTGILIEAWKVTKAVDIQIVGWGQGNCKWMPCLKIMDKHVLTEDEKKTQEYDALAFRWVSCVTMPTLAGYTIYSLIYHEHRGWYSFVISTLSSFVYAFGFIELVPQLVINYKLKSVAHMPMKAMMYKTLNTVVDDLFAFCIKMPVLHRLACFRDDVVFVVLLYQYWIYKVDYNRVNEFGQKPEGVKTPAVSSGTVSSHSMESKEDRKNK